MVVFDDFAGDGEAKTKADAAGGLEGFAEFFDVVAGEAGAGVLDFDLDLGVAVVAERGGADGDGGVVGVGLEGVEDELGEGVAEGFGVAGEVPGDGVFI